MSEAKGKGAHPWVQPIFVAKTSSHEDAVTLGAHASLRARFAPGVDEVFEARFAAWLSGPFTKTVRRGTHEQLAKVVQWAQDNGVPYADNAMGDAASVALPPMLYDDMPKVMARLQVSGTDFARGAHWRPEKPSVRLCVLDSLTTGKATAQAAHALWAWHLHNADAVGGEAMEEGAFAVVEFVSALDLEALSHYDGAYGIRDNGLTEVQSQTLTAVALG